MNSIILAAMLFASLTATVERDAFCYRNEIPVGVVVAGTEVEVLEQRADETLIYSEKHNAECWISNKAFEERGYIHPDDLERTLKWRTLVQRWMPDFPNLTEELVLSVIYKETRGDPHAVDATGNDIAMVGEASVGLMGAIPRRHLPCYETLTGANGKDEYGCQLYLGMFILNSAIEQAHELRVGTFRLQPAYVGTLTRDSECTADGIAVGWLLEGTVVDIVKAVHDASGNLSDAKVYSERHGRFCWLKLKDVELAEPPSVEVQEAEITAEDIEMGLWLYGCSLENVLNDNCLPWGRDAYSDLVLDVILPEIEQALEGRVP